MRHWSRTTCKCFRWISSRRALTRYAIRSLSSQVGLDLQEIHVDIHQNHKKTMQMLEASSQITSHLVLSIYKAMDRDRQDLPHNIHHGDEKKSATIALSERFNVELGSQVSRRSETVERTLSSLPSKHEPTSLEDNLEYSRLAQGGAHLAGVSFQSSTPCLPEYSSRNSIHRLPQLRPNFTRSSNSIVHFTLGRAAQCQKDCPCKCHDRRHPDLSWNPHSTLTTLLGSLFIGYTGFPLRMSRCNSSKCISTGSSRLNITYTFPLWFLGYSLDGFVESTATGSLTCGLKASRRIPFEVGRLAFEVQFGNATSVRRALERDRASILDKYSGDGQSALALALYRGMNVEIVRILLEHGADPDQEDDDGYTARILAARCIMLKSRSPAILQELECLFPLSKCIDSLELTYLHKAVLGICHVNLASALRRRDPFLLGQMDAQDWFGSTALHHAAHSDNLNTVQALIEAGAQLHIKGRDGFTPLACSIMTAEARCVDALIEAGAGVNDRVSEPVGCRPLHLAVQWNHLTATRSLIAAGAILDLGTDSGATPLCYAARHDFVDILQYLLDEGAQLDAGDHDGLTPIYYAVYFSSYRSQTLLIQAGANYRQISHNGKSLLHFVASNGDPRTITTLRELELSDLDIHSKDDRALTPSQIFSERTGLSDHHRDTFYQLLREIDRRSGIDRDCEGTGDIFEDAVEVLDA
jgi:ankyrin repeat protein